MTNRSTTRRYRALGAGVAAFALLATAGCAAKVNQSASSSSTSSSTSSISSSESSSSATSAGGSAAASSGSASAAPSGSMVPVTGSCSGPVNLAMNDWVGYTADAAVASYVLENDLKCKVNQKPLKEDLSWQGFASGQIDVIMENWGHEDLAAKYITTQKVALDAGQTGNLGVIGWYVPPWLAKAHPDILDWNNLNKYADQFKTSESGDKGQLLDGDPSFVTNDEALVKNLNLNFKVVYAGSEAALIKAFQDAETNKKWVIGYFYSPQWFLSEVPLVKVNLPKWTPGCDSDPAKVNCDYPVYNLNKVMSTKLAGSGSSAAAFLKNFQWTNDDQNLVAKYITADKMSPADAAKKWIDANPDKVNAWLGK